MDENNLLQNSKKIIIETNQHSDDVEKLVNSHLLISRTDDYLNGGNAKRAKHHLENFK